MKVLYICTMELEDYLIARDKLKLIINPAHKVYIENGLIWIERNKSPRFKAVVSINQSTLSIDEMQWIDTKPVDKEAISLKNKALAFFGNFYIIKKW